MEPQQNESDVLVMGGGPAGSATATRLARMGYRTTLLEKDHHPRFHIGESLLPLSLPYLQDLGVLDQVDAIGLRKYAAEFHSVYHGRHIAFPFAEAVKDDYPFAYEVRRSEFDQILFQNAGSQGVRLMEGCRVDQATFDGDRLESVSGLDASGHRINFKARFFVDATGRDTFLANALGSKKKNPKHKSAAIYAHFEGALRNEGEAEGNIAIYWFDKGWFWMIPLKGDTMSVGAVLKPEYLKSRTLTLEDFMAETIAMCLVFQNASNQPIGPRPSLEPGIIPIDLRGCADVTTFLSVMPTPSLTRFSQVESTWPFMARIARAKPWPRF